MMREQKNKEGDERRKATANDFLSHREQLANEISETLLVKMMSR